MKNTNFPNAMGSAKTFLAAALLAASGFVLTASADTTLVSDNFTNAVVVSSSSVTSTEASGVGAYSALIGNPQMSLATVSGFGDGKVLRSTLSIYRAFDDGATLSLNDLAENETLSFSFDIRFNVVPSSSMSFGFVNTTSGSLNSILYTLVDLTGAGGVNATQFKYRPGSAYMSNPQDAKLVSSNTFTEPQTLANTHYHFELSVTKVSTGFQISYYRDELLIGSDTVGFDSVFATAVGNTDITGVAFRYSSGTVVTDLDNVAVELTSVPEPATWAMLMGGMGMLALGRRMARRLKA